MHDARGMRLGETLRDLMSDVGELSCETADGEQVAQGLALRPFHGDERHADLMADVMDGQDIGMIQGGGRLGLLLEPTETIGIVGEPPRRTLMAIERLSRVSRARYTSPIPPSPSFAMIS